MVKGQRSMRRVKGPLAGSQQISYSSTLPVGERIKAYG